MTENLNSEIRMIDYFSTDYELELEIRDEVLRKPLGMSIYNDKLDKDQNDVHIAAFVNNKMVGVMLMTEINYETVKVRQVAVLEDFRDLKIGTKMNLFAERQAKVKGYKFIELNARKTAMGFYEKQGYKTIGEEFLEINIPHYKMRKEI